MHRVYEEEIKVPVDGYTYKRRTEINMYQKDKKVRTDDWIKKLKEDDLIPQLSLENSLKLEAPLSLEELKSTLEKCSKNKSPGNDGLTQEFYNHFWESIKEIYINHTWNLKKRKIINITETKYYLPTRKSGKGQNIYKELETDIINKF